MKKIFVGLMCVLTLAACSNNPKSVREAGENANREQEALSTGFSRLTRSQQIPSFDWSQERQTLIDVETIRATGALSTSQFYLEGVGLIKWCPSVGGPVPQSYQLSPSSQWVDFPEDGDGTKYEVDQGEPTGVYIGGGSGTWVLCLDDDGNKFAQYWEGYVDVSVAIIDGLDPALRIRPSDLTFEISEEQ